MDYGQHNQFRTGYGRGDQFTMTGKSDRIVLTANDECRTGDQLNRSAHIHVANGSVGTRKSLWIGGQQPRVNARDDRAVRFEQRRGKPIAKKHFRRFRWIRFQDRGNPPIPLLGGPQVGRGIAGEIRLGFVNSVNISWLPMMIGRFLRKYPQVKFSVESIDISELARRLLDERLDIGVGFLEGNRQSLKTLELFEENLVVIANRKLAIKKFRSMNLEDVAKVSARAFAYRFLHEGADRRRSGTE
jgi:hypothetical protein